MTEDDVRNKIRELTAQGWGICGCPDPDNNGWRVTLANPRGPATFQHLVVPDTLKPDKLPDGKWYWPPMPFVTPLATMRLDRIRKLHQEGWLIEAVEYAGDEEAFLGQDTWRVILSHDKFVNKAPVIVSGDEVPVNSANGWKWPASVLSEKKKHHHFHKRDIPEGVFGDFSKIEEEFFEAKDAVEQDVKVMLLIELTDLLGAIRGYMDKNYPGIGFDGLVKMMQLHHKVIEAKKEAA